MTTLWLLTGYDKTFTVCELENHHHAIKNGKPSISIRAIFHSYVKQPEGNASNMVI